MKFASLILIILYCSIVAAQDPCTFQSTSKKGAYWVFSTFFQPNTQLRLEGVCEEKNNGAPLLFREFKSGRLQKEVIYYTSGQLNTSLELYKRKRDTIIGEFQQFSEEGKMLLFERYYLDENGRRCVYRRTFHVNGNPRFDQYFTWVKYEELTDYQLPNHPPHTIDDDGYSYLMVPFGREQSFGQSGELIEEKYHQLLLDGSHEFSSLNGPFLNLYENGRIQKKCFYKNGKLNGEFVELNYLGDTISKGVYENGIKDGVWTYWHDNGALKAIHHHNLQGKYPFQPRKKEWSSSGELILQFDYTDDGIGFLKEWSESGMLTHEQWLVNLTLNEGKETFWFPNGQVKSIMDHRKNVDTTFAEWYESGREKSLKRKYISDNTTITVIKEWNPTGLLSKEIEMQKSDYVNSFTNHEYHTNGNLKYVDARKNREQHIEEYASNGTKIRSRYLLDGKLHGTYQELDSTGQLRLTCAYENGLRHGQYFYYSPTGKVNYAALYEHGRWIPKSQMSQSFFELYRTLSTVNKPMFQSAAFALLNRQLYQNEPVRLSAESVDTLAAVIWQLSRLAPHYSEWISAPEISKQLLRIRLLESYHKDLKTNEIWTEYSKELLSGLKQLGVTLPSFEFVNGEVYVTVPLKGWINQAELKRLFPSTYALFQLTHTSIGNSDYSPSYSRYTIERIQSSTWRITLPLDHVTYAILLYGDGTVEIEHQTLTWSTFLNCDLSRDNFRFEWRE
jgi:antitoxin component YwqK of YwqJK toxin-antitoxin module